MQKLLLLTSTFALVFMGAGCNFLPTDREEVLVPEPVVTMHENWETYEDR